MTNTTLNAPALDLVGIGGANSDRIGRTSGPHLASTSNPGSLNESVGGGAFNALRVAALRLSGAVGLISARGDDTAGSAVEEAIRHAGITDLSCLSDLSSTATYTAILDEAGELITALADMAIYEEAVPDHLQQPDIAASIADAGAVLVDANIPEAAVGKACEMAQGPVFAIAISASKVSRMIPSARGIDVLFMNHHEARHISGEADLIRATRHCQNVIGFKKVVVTQGALPVLIAQGHELWSVEVPETLIADVTGAGDALCGGTVAALLNTPSLPLPQAVREGIACSSLTLGVQGPYCRAIATSAFDAALATVPKTICLEGKT